MEPVKFEENIRRQLAKREIKPSADSWKKLQEKLELQEKKPRPTSWWIGIAAAAVALIFIVRPFFNSPTVGESPVVVEQNSEEIIQQDKEDQFQVVTSQKVEKTEALKTDANTRKKYKVIKKGNSKPDLIEKVKLRTRVADVGVEIKPTDNKPLEVGEPFLAVAEAVEERNGPVTDAEIEAMLIQAQRAIGKDTTLRETYAVNPNQLLDDVESELEEGFRQKVFEALKEGFSKAKTAVANRNL